jgi:hypothetical protein
VALSSPTLIASLLIHACNLLMHSNTAKEGLSIQHMDVSTAFLNGKLDHEMCINSFSCLAMAPPEARHLQVEAGVPTVARELERNSPGHKIRGC